MPVPVPRVDFNKEELLGIEVMTFKNLLIKLKRSEDHNPYHFHKIQFYLILVVTKGDYTHFVDFESYPVTDGGTIFIAKNQVHHFTKDLGECSGYGIIFNRDFVDKYYFLIDNNKLNRLFNYHIENPVITIEDMQGDSLEEVVTRLYKEYNFKNTFAKSEILGSLLHVLLLKAERSKEVKSVTTVKKMWLETFNQFRILLEQNYMLTRSSREYASKLLVSYKFLNDVVKKLTKKTVKGFIDDYVTTEIKRYLVTTSLSIKEISYEAGFEEPANMVKFFKKNADTTPLKFRQLK